MSFENLKDLGSGKPKVGKQELVKCRDLCNNAGFKGQGHEFSILVGDSLGKEFLDFRYESEQIIDSIADQNMVKKLKNIIH